MATDVSGAMRSPAARDSRLTKTIAPLIATNAKTFLCAAPQHCLPSVCERCFDLTCDLLHIDSLPAMIEQHPVRRRHSEL